MEQVPKWEREVRSQVRELNREIMRYAVSHLIDEIRRAYADLSAVVAYLEAVQKDVIENAQEFLKPEGAPAPARRGAVRPP